MATSNEINTAREDARLALYKAITEQAEETKDMTAQTAAPALKELAEAFAWITSTAQPH
ncbi:hypothetical protein [Streptomyces sp. NPDC056844]|uniref:hypothetical protein n=1 Tax=unclassified Streptomyces TaxID=2593676 RepID=UPI0036AE6F39